MNTSLLSLELPIVKAPAVSNWQAWDIAAYQQDLPHAIAAMRTDLARRLHILLGRVVAPHAVFVDADRQVASVVVDTVMFRLRRQTLVVVRPCSWCGSGQFESPPIIRQTDVGYALSAWQPSHPQCQAEDPVNWLESEL